MTDSEVLQEVEIISLVYGGNGMGRLLGWEGCVCPLCFTRREGPGSIGGRTAPARSS